ncbi:MAG: formylglycine-generating enzyme family protein, partial [Verrucomicrobiae bacterium]|nr:formylglycine-generating enzyme family protein [Verrucomicrobiae bacterium]
QFCRWLSAQEQATYRLPSEAEWEYACRAGRSTWYSWGESPDDAYRHANVADGALEAAQPGTTRFQRAVRLGAEEGDGAVFTAPTGRYQANGWGLHDMHGNVWEWCLDDWDDRAYAKRRDGVKVSPWEASFAVKGQDSPKDPANLADLAADRVFRGGSWGNTARVVRSACRLGFGPWLQWQD